VRIRAVGEGRFPSGTEISDSMIPFRALAFPAAFLAGLLAVMPVHAAQKSSGKKSKGRKSTAAAAAVKNSSAMGADGKKPAMGELMLDMPEAEECIGEGPAAQAADLALLAETENRSDDAGMPGAPHRVLEPLLGEWSTEIKIWMSPDAPPAVSHGTAKVLWDMGGRYVQEEFQGEMMGRPFSGVGLTGYDNQKQKYTTLWADDRSTAIITSEGAATNRGLIHFESKMDCPLTGEKDVPIQQVLRIHSRDKHTVEMYDSRKGVNSKSMEIVYTRK
jgi:hypothetical protein